MADNPLPTRQGKTISESVVTVVDATIDPAREADLLEGFRALVAAEKSDAIVRSELLRGQDGAWRIQTTWRDMAALKAVREAGKPHMMQLLLESLGAVHSQAFFFVAESYLA
jgi:quinol monooxygenase YgiN